MRFQVTQGLHELSQGLHLKQVHMPSVSSVLATKANAVYCCFIPHAQKFGFNGNDTE